VEKKKDAPAKGEALRTFNVFVDDDYFEVDVDEVGGSPGIKLHPADPARRACGCPAAARPRPLRQRRNRHRQLRPRPPAAAAAPKAAAAPAPAAAGRRHALPAPMPGMIVKYRKVSAMR
jgi:pyruvate carboxylase subunit B